MSFLRSLLQALPFLPYLAAGWLPGWMAVDALSAALLVQLLLGRPASPRGWRKVLLGHLPLLVLLLAAKGGPTTASTGGLFLIGKAAMVGLFGQLAFLCGSQESARRWRAVLLCVLLLPLTLGFLLSLAGRETPHWLARLDVWSVTDFATPTGQPRIEGEEADLYRASVPLVVPALPILPLDDPAEAPGVRRWLVSALLLLGLADLLRAGRLRWTAHSAALACCLVVPLLESGSDRHPVAYFDGEEWWWIEPHAPVVGEFPLEPNCLIPGSTGIFLRPAPAGSRNRVLEATTSWGWASRRASRPPGTDRLDGSTLLQTPMPVGTRARIVLLPGALPAQDPPEAPSALLAAWARNDRVDEGVVWLLTEVGFIYRIPLSRQGSGALTPNGLSR